MTKAQKIILTIVIILFSLSTLICFIGFTSEYQSLPSYCQPSTFFNHKSSLNQDEYNKMIQALVSKNTSSQGEIVKSAYAEDAIKMWAEDNNILIAKNVKDSSDIRICDNTFSFSEVVIVEITILIVITLISTPIYIIWGNSKKYKNEKTS